MSRTGNVRTMVALLSAAFVALGAWHAAADERRDEIKKAASKVAATARGARSSDTDTHTAVAVLEALVEKGVPVEHALRVVTAAVQEKRTGQEIAAIARGVEDAVEDGASSRELAILAEDLLEDDVDQKGLLVAIEAVGHLAGEGEADPEVRRSIALTALNGLKDGLKGEELAARIREEMERLRGGEAEGAPADRGLSKEKTPADVRDEVRERTPPGLAKDKAKRPGHVPDPGRRDEDRRQGPPNRP